MQGQLRGEYLSGLITTECAHCGQALHIEMDSEMKYRVVEPGAQPLYFSPLDGVQAGDASIIDGF